MKNEKKQEQENNDGTGSDTASFCCDWHSEYYFQTGQVWKCEKPNLINDLFIPYDIAEKLKKKGFNEECLGFFETEEQKVIINRNNCALTEKQLSMPSLNDADNRNSKLPEWAISAITYQQAIDWLVEHEGIFVSTFLDKGKEPEDYGWRFFIDFMDDRKQIREDEFSYKTNSQAIKRAFKKVYLVL